MGSLSWDAVGWSCLQGFYRSKSMPLCQPTPPGYATAMGNSSAGSLQGRLLFHLDQAKRRLQQLTTPQYSNVSFTSYRAVRLQQGALGEQQQGSLGQTWKVRCIEWAIVSWA